MVLTRIKNDLRYIVRPSCISEEVYADQLLYGAAAQWIKMVTLDYDPLLGNNKVGVSRPYLVERTSSALRHLAEICLPGRNITNEQIKSSIEWMVDSLCDIGELWDTNGGRSILACPATRVAWEYGGYARLIGRLSAEEHILTKQIGLGLYSRESHWFEDINQEKERLERERALLELSGNELPSLGIDPSAIMRELARAHPSKDGYLIIPAAECSEQTRLFLLSCAWPVNNEPFSWEKPDNWLVPILR